MLKSSKTSTFEQTQLESGIAVGESETRKGKFSVWVMASDLQQMEAAKTFPGITKLYFGSHAFDFTNIKLLNTKFILRDFLNFHKK
jgi:hypothetical protein